MYFCSRWAYSILLIISTWSFIISDCCLSTNYSLSLHPLFIFCYYSSWSFIASSCDFHYSRSFYTSFFHASSFLRTLNSVWRSFCYFYCNYFSSAAFWANDFWTDSFPSSLNDCNSISLDVIILSRSFFFYINSYWFSSICLINFFFYVSSLAIASSLALPSSNYLSSCNCFFQMSSFNCPTSCR